MSAALEVNECRVVATDSGNEWWTAFRQVFSNTGRITVLSASLGGEVVSVSCDDREHAEWLRETAVRNGIPKSALKVTKGVTS
jgi:hypothetical protein